MANTLVEVSDLIVAKLESLMNGSDRLIPEVRDYAEVKKDKYPLAEVLPTRGATTQRIDTGRNQRTFEFEIKLYQEQSESGRGPELSTDITKTVIDQVLLAFDTDKDFGMEIENLMIPQMDFDYSPAAGPKVFATFTVQCVIIVPNV